MALCTSVGLFLPPLGGPPPPYHPTIPPNLRDPAPVCLCAYCAGPRVLLGLPALGAMCGVSVCSAYPPRYGNTLNSVPVLVRNCLHYLHSALSARCLRTQQTTHTYSAHFVRCVGGPPAPRGPQLLGVFLWRVY